MRVAAVLAIGAGLKRENGTELTLATATQSPIVKREPHTHAQGTLSTQSTQSTLPGDWTSGLLNSTPSPLDNSYLYTTSPAPPQPIQVLMQAPDPRQGHLPHSSYQQHQADTAAPAMPAMPAMHHNNSRARRESSFHCIPCRPSPSVRPHPHAIFPIFGLLGALPAAQLANSIPYDSLRLPTTTTPYDSLPLLTTPKACSDM